MEKFILMGKNVNFKKLSQNILPTPLQMELGNRMKFSWLHGGEVRCLLSFANIVQDSFQAADIH